VNHSPFTIDHSPHKKTAVMRKFLRNAFPIAFFFVIANLFLANTANATGQPACKLDKGT
jgi:hypothetical protein